MKVGLIDILVSEAPGGQTRFHRHLNPKIFHRWFSRQYTSIMTQAVSVWCRQNGHDVYYSTYWGQDLLENLVPPDVDVLFVASFTQSSPLAYALAKIFKKRGTVTVLGGPHAKAFPKDSVRFYDIVVQHCDRGMVEDIVNGVIPPGSIVSTGSPPSDLPTIEERLPEITIGNYMHGEPYVSTTVPIITSTGCPYTCNFCVDARVDYHPMFDQFEADLIFLRDNMPGIRLGFQDPNFAVKFDSTLDILERVGNTNPYMAESTLSILRGNRLARLRDTACCYIAPGIESWTDYSNKAGVNGTSLPGDKLERVVEHIHEIGEHISGIQTNFIFGLDIDSGDEPIALTQEFVRRCPEAWPIFNIPVPFGGTELHDRYLAEGRILPQMPLGFYYAPYLVTTLLNYTPLDFYGKLAELHSASASRRLLLKRLALPVPLPIKAAFVLRVQAAGRKARDFRRILGLLEDPEMRRFHSRESDALPEVYHREYEQRLGVYAPLITREDRVPVFG